MAEELGMPATSYADYETARPTQAAAIRYLCRQYDITFDFILYGDFGACPPTARAHLQRHARDAKPKGSARRVG